MISTIAGLLGLSPGDRRTRIVLVVDDEKDIRDAVQHLLERALPTVRVETAASGEEGLAILRREPIDLIVTDYKMPGMNGVEFLAQALKIAPKAPRILITAFEQELAIELGRNDEVSIVLTKPLSPRPLVQTCERILAGGTA
jgi:CheY-like chemotaxis protein